MSDYADILKQSFDDIPEVKTLPDGSWLLRGQSGKFQPSKDADKSDKVLFTYIAKEPMDDVDAEALNAMGDDYEFDANRVFFSIYVGSKSDWDKVRRHLELHGISTKGKSLEEGLNEFKGSEVIAYLSTRTYQNAAGQMVESNEPSNFTPVA